MYEVFTMCTYRSKPENGLALLFRKSEILKRCWDRPELKLALGFTKELALLHKPVVDRFLWLKVPEQRQFLASQES